MPEKLISCGNIRNVTDKTFVLISVVFGLRTSVTEFPLIAAVVHVSIHYVEENYLHGDGWKNEAIVVERKKITLSDAKTF